MKSLLIFVILASAVVGRGQRTTRQGQDDASGWDIRLAVPGEPGSDYPTLSNIPRTSFSCAGKTPGYYADTETNCQAFRICTIGSTYGFQSFLCPNGTLFNQAVFVCDWWMNVNCDSIQSFPNTEKFGNLRLGPQLMSDVRKMLTHPMRNPYDKSAMKSNLIVMQNYIPPSGQPTFPSAQIQLPKRTQDVYAPAKLQQQSFGYNRVSDNLLAGSTAGPQYAPPQNDAEVFQKQVLQSQNGQYVHDNSGNYVHNMPNNQNHVQQPSSRLTAPSRQYVQSNVVQSPQQIGQYRQNSFQVTQPASGNIVTSAQAGRLTQATQYTNYNDIGSSSKQGNYQYNQPVSTQNYNTQTNQRQNAQYNSNNNFLPSQPLNNGKRTGFEISYAKQQFNANQEKQPYNYNAPQFSNEITGQVGNDAKQNLVSQATPTVITKTLTFNRILQAPKAGAPKSRITFKTWIVKPSSKSAKLIAEPTPYSYNRPTSPPSSEKIILEPTPYYYNKPTTTTTAQTAKLVSESGYSYSRPTTTQTAKLVSEAGYSYNKPTVAAKQVEVIRKTPQPFVPPSTIASTIPSRHYLSPSPPPTVPARQYLAPTTFKPAVRLYLPPSEKSVELSRQYLLPTTVRSEEGQNAKLQASPSTPTPVYAAPSRNNLFSLIKHSRINTNHNNLTFTDILTKEKLDITVNDIVKDTSKILGTASPQSGQLRQEVKPDELEEVYLPPSTSPESAEILTNHPSTIGPSKSAKLQAKPSVDLLPPENFERNQVQNSNRIAQLPFFKEPSVPTNTIERTVSLKISIPEKTAAYLFKQCNDSDFDKLEILNTGSSNYLVLTNKIAKNHIPSFIPIGKLIVDKGTNISDSQALVFSFLADSLNQAKEYNTIAEQNLHSTSSAQSHFQNVNNEELAQITDKVAQLTSAQFANNNEHQSANVQTTNSLGSRTQMQKTAKFTNQYNNNAQINALPQTQNVETGQYHSRYQTNSNNIESNENQIYSGQLYQIPVPDVSGIYSGQSSAKLITPSSVQQHTELADLQQHHSNQNGNHANNNNLNKQSSAEVEVVQSHSLPQQPQSVPAKLQAAPGFQQESFNSQEDSTLLGNFVPDANGISAQLRDKIVGTIAHPSEKNKLVTYKKDQSYYVYTKFDHGNNVVENFQSNQLNSDGQQRAKLVQSSNADNALSYQFVPSVSYQLDDEKDQQRILNTFNIDEYGNPRGRNQNNILSSDVDYAIQHQQQQNQQVQSQQTQYNAPNNLYTGPSSYSAPQASVGRLEANGNYNNAAKLEQFEENSGYTKAAPARSFSF